MLERIYEASNLVPHFLKHNGYKEKPLLNEDEVPLIDGCTHLLSLKPRQTASQELRPKTNDIM